jgi:protein TonB
MSATAEGGGFAAPVGNTLYGKAPERAPDPAEVKPYRADRYAAPTEVSRMPVAVETTIPPSEYPEEARKLGVEGPVRLRLQVDAEGRVASAEVLSEPGHGLGAAAARNARQRFRFQPALRDGQPVATELVFLVRWELP